MIKGVEDSALQGVINGIVQMRVLDKVCLDCGKSLIDTAGYCRPKGNRRRRCGHVKTPVTYTNNDFKKAEEFIIRNKRNYKRK